MRLIGGSTTNLNPCSRSRLARSLRRLTDEDNEQITAASARTDEHRPHGSARTGGTGAASRQPADARVRHAIRLLRDLEMLIIIYE